MEWDGCTYIAAADTGVCYTDEDVVRVIEGGDWAVFEACVLWSVEET